MAAEIRRRLCGQMNGFRWTVRVASVDFDLLKIKQMEMKKLHLRRQTQNDFLRVASLL